MKRTAMAFVEEIIDFTTKEEAEQFVKEARENGYRIEEHYNGEKIGHTKWDDGSYVEWNKKKVSEFWTVIARKPYRNYPTGW